MAQDWLSILGKSKKKKNINIYIMGNPAGRMGYTGAGADGIVQPHKPAVLDMATNPPSVYHEGEGILQNNKGVKRIIPANMTNMIIPQTEKGQMNLERLQKSKGYPGYLLGGTTIPESPKLELPETQLPKLPELELQNKNLVSQTPLLQPKPLSVTTTDSSAVADRTVAPLLQPKPLPVTTTDSTTDSTVVADKTVTPLLQPEPLPVTTIGPKAPTEQKPTDVYGAGMAEGYAGIRDIARGQSEVDKSVRERELSYFDATTAAERDKYLQQLTSQGQSPERINALMSVFDRNRGMARSSLASELGIKTSERAETALRDMVTYGQQLTQLGREDELFELEKEKYGMEKEAMADSEIDGRLKLLINAPGVGINELKADGTLRASIAKRLNVDPNDPMVDREIEIRHGSTMLAMKSSFADMLNTSIEDRLESGVPLEDILKDEDIMHLANSFNGGKADVQAITNEITNRYNRLARDPVESVWEALPKAGLEDYFDTPGSETAAKAFIGDILRSGKISYNDETGEINYNDNVLWPWDNPETHFQYTDWNGEDIKYTNGQLPAGYWNAAISGYTYKQDGEDKSVSFGEAQEKWDGLGIKDKYDYIDDNGEIDVKAFLEDYFKPVKNIIQHTISELDKIFVEDEDLVKAFEDPLTGVKTNFISYAEYPKDDPRYAESTPKTDGNFRYFDENGREQFAPVGGNLFRQIWQQFSEDAGKPMSVTEFSTKWEEGKPYRIGSDGKILNYDAGYQKENNLSADNEFRIEDDPYIELPFAESVPKTQTWQVDQTGSVGKNSYRSAYDSKIYEPKGTTAKQKALTSQFTTSMKGWIYDNKGKTFKYNDKYYVIDEENPIKYMKYDSVQLNYSKEQGFWADHLVVYDPDKPDDKIYINFGIKAEGWG
jgi:hypothetical protein